jgi:hypothetical protein
MISVTVADQPMPYGEENFPDLAAALVYAITEAESDTDESIDWISAEDAEGNCWNLINDNGWKWEPD